eukprot:COSAG02_NODE_1244_length_13677_cov_50.752246_6_plen_146_part_00
MDSENIAYAEGSYAEHVRIRCMIPTLVDIAGTVTFELTSQSLSLCCEVNSGRKWEFQYQREIANGTYFHSCTGRARVVSYSSRLDWQSRAGVATIARARARRRRTETGGLRTATRLGLHVGLRWSTYQRLHRAQRSDTDATGWCR